MTASVTHLAVSNIAWDPSEDDAVARVLHAADATGVEIAPTKWRDRPLETTPAEIASYRRAWEDRGLRIISLQSLLFGYPDLQLFGDASSRAAMSDLVRRTIDLAAGLGAHALVFGSPKNRVRGALPLEQATAIAVDFFRVLGEHAHVRHTALCIEANPPGYGCDFITTTAEAVELCRLVDHPGVRVNGDLGGMTMSGEDPATSLQSAAPFLAHFHASEPNLAALGTSAAHARAAEGLSRAGYDGWVSVEMRPAANGNNVAAVERAVRFAAKAYA
jgi:D-psicose/D-tagatose/L-ribulose 3-epimerase